MQWLREWIKAELLKRDAVLSRPPGQFSVTAHKLEQAKRYGLQVKMAIDGGAAEGGWAVELRQVWPQAKVLCVEPRDEAQAQLKRVAAELGDVHVAQTLLGATDGQVEFFECGYQSSILKDAEGKEWGTKTTAPITTLDSLITKMGLPDPDLIKLDLQGFELECLRGASRCLKNAQAAILEVSFYEFQKGAPLVAEVVQFMSERGYRLYDVLGLWHRTDAGGLAYGDWLFVSESSPLLAK